MAMIPLQRGFFSATNSATTATTSTAAVSSSFFSFSTPSTSSALRLRLFMAKLQCKPFNNYPGNCLPCSSFRKARLSCMITTNHAKVKPEIFPLTSCGDGFNGAFNLQSRLRLGFFNSLGPVDSCSYGRLCLSSHGAFPKRFSSQVSNVVSEFGNMGIQDGFGKQRKRAKALAAQRKNRETSSFSSKDTDLEASTNGKEDMKHGSSVSTSTAGNSNEVSKVNGKKNSRSKKSTRQIAATDTSVEANAADVRVPQAKRSSNRKMDKDSLKASELNSTGNMPAEMTASSSKKTLASKKGGKMSKKGKSVKAANKLQDKDKAQVVGQVKLQRQMNLKPLYPPTGKSVVVVESVTKAKVIQGYLGDMYEVLPSYGHVRDLAARSGSVRPDDDFSMLWEVPSAAWTHLKSIKVALSGAENLILASDPDREGEAIAWHIIEMLQQQDSLREDTTVARVVFHEITEASIKNALLAPREIDINLVQAYLARRALDYLIGFNISPLLWRKLPGCQSAGRVQSAALALICDREMEIDEFKPQEYWTIETELNKKELGSEESAVSVPAKLTHYDSKKLNQFSIGSNTEAEDIEKQIYSAGFQVVNSKISKLKKNSPTPYITSTLQQDSANKLHFSSTYTMKLAQKLYEGVQLSDGRETGLITYTRTDGLHISDEAVNDIRSFVMERYGKDFASLSARKYFKKVKNAQEAHEAIRPTDISRLPSMLNGILDEDSLKLYTLIWCRTVACQMEPATIKQIQVDVGNAAESIIFRSSCSMVEFFGYQAVFKDMEAAAIGYKETEGNDRDEVFRILNSLKPGDSLHISEVELKQHHTQPPPRYSEGSLVKKMEELGIGRPSTYASTLKVLQSRNYVTVKSRVLYPEFRGRMVSAFLCHHFSEVTDFSFTADMENELDNVSAGLTEWKGLLRDYWTRFSSYCERASLVHIHQVEKMLEKKFGDSLFASLPEESRTCPSCLNGTLVFKVSRFGAGYFIGCDQHPKCKYIARTLYGDEEEEENPSQNNVVDEPKVLGLNPGSDEKILLKHGPYGYYVQLGEDRKGYSPPRSSVSHIKNVDSVTLDVALMCLRYPRTLGDHPTTGDPVIMKLGKNGFIVRHKRSSVDVPKSANPDNVTLEMALKFLAGPHVRQTGRPKNKPKVEEAIEAM
ncbi:hypothetical protein UlMin_044000 [Ulmus minor]